VNTRSLPGNPSHAASISHKRRECFIRMTSTARGNSRALPVFTLVSWLLLLLVPGCLGTGGGDGFAPRAPEVAAPVPTASPVLSASATALQTPRADPIVGTWYAPSPDDLTFEFHADGTFTERSPNFATYQGSWIRSEQDFYDAFILDRWGYRKPANLLYASGSLLTKGIGPMHRIA